MLSTYLLFITLASSDTSSLTMFKLCLFTLQPTKSKEVNINRKLIRFTSFSETNNCN